MKPTYSGIRKKFGLKRLTESKICNCYPDDELPPQEAAAYVRAIMRIEAVIAEAHRFLDRVEAYRDAVPTDDGPLSMQSPRREAALRASLDLTRALAKFRRRPGP